MPRGDLDDFELERTPYTPKDDAEPAPGRAARPQVRPEPTEVEIHPAELEPDSSEVEPEPGTRLESPIVRDDGGRLFPLTLAAVALIAIGVLALLYVFLRTPQARTPPAAAGPVPRTAAPTPAATLAPEASDPSLPPLDESDAQVRGVAAGLGSHPELGRWLGQAGLVRTLAAVVANVAEGETPRPHLGLLAPAQRFRAAGRGRRIVADPAGFTGYDRFADAIASVDASDAAAAYRRLEPLFDAAWRELGHPEGRFREGLERALAALLAAPVPPADAELVPHAIGFRWADPRLEALTPAQKQLLRTGPRNVRLVQAKLRELQAALGAAEQTPPAGRAR